MRYMVELRSYTEDGDDYNEDHYAFSTREECLDFARRNRSEVHSVHDYQDRDYNPINLKY